MPSWRGRLRDRYPPWTVLDDPPLDDPAAQVARDAELAAAVARPLDAPVAAPRYRVWTNRRCLVVTTRERRLPAFEAAAAASARRGWPVVLRDSGGTAVPHLPTTLLLTLVLPRRPAPEPRADEVFALLCEPAIEALADLGVSAGYGAVPRSFCDGRFNLVVNGRKIAGTAQRWRGGLPGHPVRAGYVLAHLALYVAADMRAATAAVNAFLQDAGSTDSFDPAAMTTVKAEAPHLAGDEDDRTLLVRVRAALLAVLRA